MGAIRRIGTEEQFETVKENSNILLDIFGFSQNVGLVKIYI